MRGNRSTGANPFGLIVAGFFFLVFFLSSLGRGGGGFFGLFVMLVIAVVAWRLIRIGMREAEAPASVATAVEPVVTAASPPPPDTIDEADLRGLEDRLAALADLRDRGLISAAEYERRRADAIRTF